MKDQSIKSNGGAPNPFSTLKGGETITVTIEADPRVAKGPETEQIFVRQLAIKFYPELLTAMKSQDEVAKAALYAGRPREWVESLAPASHEALITKGDELNADFFGRWLERRKKNDELLPKRDPGELLVLLELLQKSNPKLLEDLVAKAMPAGAASSNTSPTSVMRPGLVSVSPTDILSPS